MNEMKKVIVELESIREQNNTHRKEMIEQNNACRKEIDQIKVNVRMLLNEKEINDRGKHILTYCPVLPISESIAKTGKIRVFPPMFSRAGKALPTLHSFDT